MQRADEVDAHRMTVRTGTEVTDRALAWLAERPREVPFFLWLHYFDPHDPYVSPPEHRDFGGAESGLSGDRRSALRAAMQSALAAATPLKRIGAPDDIGGAAVYLASPCAGWVTGAVLPVDGGLVTTH